MIGEAIRLAALGPADEVALARLFAANDTPDVVGFFDPFPLDAASARRLIGHTGLDLYWGIWSGDELVGLAMVRGWDGGHPHRASGLFVDRLRHGEGIGSTAMKLVVAELRAAGEATIRARVHEANRASVGMLRAAGYREIARADGRIVFECRL